MTIKHLLIAIAVLLVLGGFYFLFYQTQPFTQAKKTSESKVASLSGQTVESLRKKYPHLQPPPQTWFEQTVEKPTLTWEEWVDTNVALAMHGFLYVHWKDGPPMPWFLEAYDTPEKLAAVEADYRKAFEESAERYQKQGASVPLTAQTFPSIPKTQEEIENPRSFDIYEGPQDIGSIMAEFDHRYHRLFSEERAAEIDAAYPKEAWIQAFLDKGGSFRDIYDYDKYMNSREILMNRAKDPSVWTSEIGGVRPASTLEAYTDAFIEREIWIQETWKRALKENPDVTGVAIEGDHYLPLRPNMAYVRNNGAGGITSWGGGLSLEDHDNLRRGIEPEGMDIVYIDEDYNITEKPPPWDPKSPDAKARTEKALKEMIPEIRTFEDSDVLVEPDTAPVRPDGDSVGPDVDMDAMRREAAREAAAREVAKAEFERFQDSMRQRKEFETMADKEVSRELAKQFSKQFLSKHSLKQGTSKQLENALELMFQHGFEEGFRRLRKDDAGLAVELERQLAETHRPPKPQMRRQNNVPPKTPETPPETEAP